MLSDGSLLSLNGVASGQYYCSACSNEVNCGRLSLQHVSLHDVICREHECVILPDERTRSSEHFVVVHEDVVAAFLPDRENEGHGVSEVLPRDALCLLVELLRLISNTS
jgi:hypothetical protein